MRPRRSRNLRSLGIGAAIAVGASLGVLAPAAMAAPANDHFEDRTVLTGPLPIHLSDSNEGATKDPGEPLIGHLANAGHSLWWEWEAPATEWITVSVCESDFLADVNVFEGTELEHLVSLTDEHINGDEGPQCWATGTTFTFAATAGHHYVIGADGNDFYVPPPAPEEPVIPSGEGEIKLSIEATPPPPNDGFADAIPIGSHFLPVNESPFEEPNEDRYFIEQTTGYNWGATKEPGEADHAGDPGGASVWYSWTPPESGEIFLSLQGAGGPKLLALYAGSALTELNPIASVGEGASFSGFHAAVTAGTEYRIAVDGSRAENALEPWRGSFMGSFNLSIQEKLPPAPESEPELPQGCGCGGEARPNPTPGTPIGLFPKVRLGAHEVDAAAGSATFRFGSARNGATFKCKVDGGAYRRCFSPFHVKDLKPGRHVLRVLATYLGTVSPRPAVVHFTVPAVHRHQHRS